MEAREEVKTHHYSCRGLFDHGLDGLPDYGYKDDGAEDLGSLQHTRYFKGKVSWFVARF